MESKKITVGGAGAPNKFTYDTIAGEVDFWCGTVLDGLSIDGVFKSNEGGVESKITLQSGEYFKEFELVANMQYLGGVITGGKFITNLGNQVEFNTGNLPKSYDPPASAKVTNCKVHAISVIYGSYINQMTVHYISDYNPDE